MTLTCKETLARDASSGESRSKATSLESASCAQQQQAALRRTSWVRQGRRALFLACKLFKVKSRGLFVSVLPGLSIVLPVTDPWSVFSVSQPTACTATLAGSEPPDALPIMTKEGWQTEPGTLLVTDTCEHGADLDSWPESQHRGRNTSMPTERHLNVRWHRGTIHGLRKRHRYSPCSPQLLGRPAGSVRPPLVTYLADQEHHRFATQLTSLAQQGVSQFHLEI